MCKFCEKEYVIKTSIGGTRFMMYLDSDDKTFLNCRIPFDSLGIGGGMTRPFKINYCPFCGKKLKEEEENCMLGEILIWLKKLIIFLK